jgi:hypothetical protein
MTMLHETPTLTAVTPQILLGNHLKALISHFRTRV